MNNCDYLKIVREMIPKISTAVRNTPDQPLEIKNKKADEIDKLNNYSDEILLARKCEIDGLKCLGIYQNEILNMKNEFELPYYEVLICFEPSV